eukprot:471941-Prorocentrum_minimum.AAC.1
MASLGFVTMASSSTTAPTISVECALFPFLFPTGTGYYDGEHEIQAALHLLVRRLRLAPSLRLQRGLRLELRLEAGAELRLALQRLLVVLLATCAVLLLAVRAVLHHHLIAPIGRGEEYSMGTPL